MASYKTALRWIILNDDTIWLDDGGPISVTATLVADLFNKTDEQVTIDLRREMTKLKRESMA